jgi:beta-glucosidase
MKKLPAAVLCLVFSAAVSFAQQPAQNRPPALSFEELAQLRQQYPFADPKLPMEQRITDLLSRMTSDEKVACLGTQTGVPRLGVPNIGSSEGIHGVVQREERFGRKPVTTTQFPQPPGMGETWDPEMVRAAGGVQGYEARYITQTAQYNRQILMTWGPQSDLMRDPRWGRSEEVYGEDPFFNGTMAVAFTRGIQGDDPKYWQAAALLKHFLANENENYRNVSSSDFDERLFWEYYSVPFRMAFLEGDAKAVMASYNGWNGTPMAVNPILKSIVRDKWGVDILSSDGGAVKLLWDSRHLYKDQKEAVVACLKAGINQFLDKWADETKAALKDGSVTEKEIDDLLRPKFRVTIRLGLLDPLDMVPYSKIKDGTGSGDGGPWNGDKHKEVSKKMALESVVLLKNDKDFLPLKKDSIKSIAVVGPLANTVEWDWYGGTPPYKVTPLDGIKAALPANVKVNFAADNTDGAIVDALKKSELAVVVIGNNPTCGDMAKAWYSTYEGGGVTLPCTNPSDGREGRDRESIDTTQEQIVKQAYEATKGRVVVVLISSFPLAINWTQEHVPAILHMAHSSQDEGTALAEVLFGDYNPGGHTVETWPKSLDQIPPMMDYNIRHGKTYMYFKGEPLYPFGFGLSYTTFKYANLRTSTPQVAKNGAVTVSVDVTNTGSRAGDAVVQLYVKHLASKVERPEKQLKGFQRVTLQPGETKTVEIPLKASALAYWDEKTKDFRVETEPVRLMAGGSSAELPASATLKVQ